MIHDSQIVVILSDDYEQSSSKSSSHVGLLSERNSLEFCHGVKVNCSTVGISKYQTVMVYRLRVFDWLFKKNDFSLAEENIL